METVGAKLEIEQASSIISSGSPKTVDNQNTATKVEYLDKDN